MPTGIFESLLLKIDAEKESLDKEIKKMNSKKNLADTIKRLQVERKNQWNKQVKKEMLVILIKRVKI